MHAFPLKNVTLIHVGHQSYTHLHPHTHTHTHRKPPPPKVLPKPVHRRNSSGQRDSQSSEVNQEEKEVGIPHVNGPVPSPDPNVITIQSTSSSEPLNVRPVIGEEVELHGDIKIQKVAHTRWVPPKRSPEQVHRTMSLPVQSSLLGSPAEGPINEVGVLPQ